MKKIILPLILAALFMWTAAASAQTAQEMTKDCTLSSVGKKTLNNMTDGRYTSYWSSSTNRNAYLDIEAPQGQKMGSVYIQFFENAAPFDVQTPDEAGNWQTISTYETGFLAQYVPLDAGYEKIRIRPKDAEGTSVHHRAACLCRRGCAGLGTEMGADAGKGGFIGTCRASG